MELHNGDCFDVMKTFEDNSIDIVIADLPYGRFKHLDWDKTIDLERMWEELWRISKPTTPIFLFGDFRFANILLNSQPKWFRYEMVWEKTSPTNFLNMRKMIGKTTEYVLVFYKKQPVYNYLKYHKIDKKQVWSDKPLKTLLVPKKGITKQIKNRCQYEPRLPTSVFKCGNIKIKLLQSVTEKPQPLLEHLLKYFSNEDDVCLDFTMGSGSCGVACKTLGRKFIGIELNKEHFDVAEKRLIG
jgi:DNA modification methylase